MAQQAQAQPEEASKRKLTSGPNAFSAKTFRLQLTNRCLHGWGHGRHTAQTQSIQSLEDKSLPWRAGTWQKARVRHHGIGLPSSPETSLTICILLPCTNQEAAERA